jgi:hypothetical protein
MPAEPGGFFLCSKNPSPGVLPYIINILPAGGKNYSNSAGFGKNGVRKREDFMAGNQIFCPVTDQIEVCIFKIIILAPHKNLL